MYCYQCEQALRGACSNGFGVCGKTADTAEMQDVLIYSLKGMAAYTSRLQKSGYTNQSWNDFMVEALFATLTNVNFDRDNIVSLIARSAEIKEEAKRRYTEICRNPEEELNYGAPAFKFTGNTEELLSLAAEISIPVRKESNGAVITGVEELITYGLKGVAAYVHHASVLQRRDEEVFDFINDSMSFLNESHTLEELLGRAMEIGRINLRAMELLDDGHTSTFGHPVPVKVRTTAIKGKAILVSGHDLNDLAELLKQTEGKGINIYTHSEMLPAHGYPELKKYKHLVANYGGAWQDQIIEFNAFPGAILMTTNCIQKPLPGYTERIFTTGPVEFPGVEHIADKDFSRVIEKALELPGFEEDEEEKTIMTGFGRNAVLGVADKVIDAVKAGQIKHFFLVGGCDGMKSGRNYYTEFAASAPKDTVILTLACGKYRFNKLEFGDIGGIPRLLDVGQCNDAYSAIKIAVALAEAFGTDVNSLPLSLILSWYEQKAVSILLTLLYLGIKNIRIGPSLPSFIEPEVLGVLVDNFNLMPITTAENDLAAILDK